jgi:acetolactate synthase small subunit
MHQPHVLELTVGPEPGVIDRVVGVCRARRCRIVALHYVAADVHAPGTVRLIVSAPASRVRALEHRLGTLVDVLAVGDAARAIAAPPRRRDHGRMAAGRTPTAGGARQ